jgi:hypothetical protein
MTEDLLEYEIENEIDEEIILDPNQAILVGV